MARNAKTYPKLDQNLEADVCVIGGGLTGVMTAYLLSKTGKSVVLLEEKTIASGATAKTTGFLTQAVDTDYTDLVKMFGMPAARKILQSHGEAIDLVEAIIESEDIDCHFKREPNFLYAKDEKELAGLREESAVLASLNADAEMVPADLLNFPNAGALAYFGQAKFYATEFVPRIASIAAKNGVRIFEKTRAKAISEEPLSVHAGRYAVKADWIISATYHPFNEPVGLRLRKATYISYVYSLKIPSGALKSAMYEDQHKPYHYFRVDAGNGHDTVIVGGEDHRADVPVPSKANFRALRRFAEATFPNIPFTVESRWTGPILEPIDGIASIGSYGNPNILYAFGFSGNGMTYGSIAAIMFRDRTLGIKNPWDELYDPNRLPNATSLVIKGKDYIDEFLQGAVKNTLARRR